MNLQESLAAPIAEAVLTSPEFQAIKKALMKATRISQTHVWNQDDATVLGWLGLPVHVVEWVMS